MNGYIKYFDNGGNNMSLLIKNSEVWEKYEEIWDVITTKYYSNHRKHEYELDDKSKKNVIDLL